MPTRHHRKVPILKQCVKQERKRFFPYRKAARFAFRSVMQRPNRLINGTLRITRTPRIVRTARIIHIVLDIDLMRIRIATNEYSNTAVLVAVKKQQAFADWRMEEQDGNTIVLSCANIKSSMTTEDCERRLRQQLDDEQIREKLEKDFGDVRNLLVNAALSPIIHANGKSIQ